MSGSREVLSMRLRDEVCKVCGRAETTIMTDKSCPRAADNLLTVLGDQVDEAASDSYTPDNEPFVFPLGDGTTIQFAKGDRKVAFGYARLIVEEQVVLCADSRIRYDSGATQTNPEFDPLTTYDTDDVIRLLHQA